MTCLLTWRQAGTYGPRQICLSCIVLLVHGGSAVTICIMTITARLLLFFVNIVLYAHDWMHVSGRAYGSFIRTSGYLQNGLFCIYSGRLSLLCTHNQI